MSEIVRERLAAAQTELMRALSLAGPVPEGFDDRAVRAEAHTLSRKRSRAAAKARPSLVRSLGRSRFVERFAGYAASQKNPGSPVRDAENFQRWLAWLSGASVSRCDAPEARAGALARGAEASVRLSRARSTRSAVEPLIETYEAIASSNAILQTIARESGPAAACSAYLPLWVAALGAVLDPDQRRAIEAHALSRSSPGETAGSVLDSVLRALSDQLELERLLARVLRPDQLELVRRTVGSDPFFGVDVAFSDDAVLGQEVASAWREAFKLGEAAHQAALPIAHDMIRRARELEASRGSRTSGDREARLEGARALVRIQLDSERELSLSPALSDAERSRVARGHAEVFRVESSVRKPTTSLERWSFQEDSSSWARLWTELNGGAVTHFRLARPFDDSDPPEVIAERLLGRRPARVETMTIKATDGGGSRRRGYTNTQGPARLHIDDAEDLPPHVIIMICKRASEEGGESLVLDIWRLLAEIEAADPELFEKLFDSPRRVPFAVRARDMFGPTIALRGGNLLVHHGGGAPTDDVGRRFARWIERARPVEFKAEANDVFISNNHGSLHGRRAYTDSSREFLRIWAWFDEPLKAPERFVDRARAVARSQEARLVGEPAWVRQAFGLGLAPSAAATRWRDLLPKHTPLAEAEAHLDRLLGLAPPPVTGR